MALSLDSIYKPISDFFLNLFKTDSENPVFFRFAKIGSVISDEDFIDPHFPTQYSPSLAREYFSDIVNNIPIEDPDGENIFFTQNDIDETFHDRLLGPSIPFVPNDSASDVSEMIINSFSAIKADAIKNWDNIRAESSTGLMMDYRPSLASPENWYDKTKNDLWTPYSFHVEETTAPASTESPKFQLWKMRLNDDQLQKAFPVLETSTEVKPQVLMSHPMIFKAGLFKVAATDTIEETPKVRPLQPAIKAATVTSLARANVVTTPPIFSAGKVVAIDGVVRSPVKQNFHNAFWGLNVKNRVLVSQYIKDQAPTQPVKTNSFSISFKYCVINIDRPWLKSSFIYDKNWFIPNTIKGQLTTNDNSGGNMPVLPISFVAIKELIIEANWSQTDIEISKSATDFGPFEVDSQIINNKLSHEGIQIIGWLLQKMPDLPPNDPPQ